jgi:hypothetical protein
MALHGLLRLAKTCVGFWSRDLTLATMDVSVATSTLVVQICAAARIVKDLTTAEWIKV